MTVPADHNYPTAATNEAWQKKKSFIDKAKASTKTGLGADLTEAKKKWDLVPWAELDAAKLGAKTVEAAQKQLQAAKAANTQIQAAKTALNKAKATARATQTNKALSSTAQAAAGAIATDLQNAVGRLDGIKVTDFEQALQRLEASAIIKVYKLRMLSAGKEVATGNAATWDRKLLKVKGMAWKVGKADDYKGKTLGVHGETEGSDAHAEGISKVFANDMKLESSSGTEATFKA
jgi:hypothetical protein